MSDCRKVSLSFPEEMNAEIEAEARRRGASVSNLLRWSWLAARKRLKELPSPAQMVPIP